jgi:hypothetical protein
MFILTSVRLLKLRDINQHSELFVLSAGLEMKSVLCASILRRYVYEIRSKQSSVLKHNILT